MRCLIALFLVLPLVAPAQSLDELASWMTGSFSSAAQAEADTNYYAIELEMARIWPERTDGVWLYVEQAVAAKKEKPYRQRVYHVQQLDDSTFTSTILKIEGGERFFGGYADPALLDSLHEGLLTELEGCAITLHRRGDAYVGSTDGRACTNAWGEAAYATSEVILSSGRMVSWDRGYNDTGEQVWGAVGGGYVFERKP